MTEILEAMTRPDVNGAPSLPKRSAPMGVIQELYPNDKHKDKEHRNGG